MFELASYMGPAAPPLLVFVDVVGSVALAPEILQQLYDHILRTEAFVVMEE